ncbi:MAG: hypothetical protein J4F40_13500 [Alphaproteobacteria bacterium]|nr:hypothetical protein [Alphaproteobacteria bacterium]
MTLARERHENNVFLGAGEIYLDLLDADGNRSGERYLGDSVSATIGITADEVTIQSGDGAVAQSLVQQQRSVTRTLTIVLHDQSLENARLFFGGDAVAAAAAAATEQYDRITVRKGRWYQLGLSGQSFNGADKAAAGSVEGHARISDTAGKLKLRKITNAENFGNATLAQLKGAAAAGSGIGAALSETTDPDRATNDFQVDHERGRIYIEPGSTNIVAANEAQAEIVVLYDAVAVTDRKKVEVTSPGQTTAAVRYLEDGDDAIGAKGRHIYARKCNIRPGGDFALKSRDSEQQATLIASIVEPGGAHPVLLIDGVES